MAMITPERDLEEALVSKLKDLKYEYRPDIRDRATLERNFREKFESLNRVTLTDGEFQSKHPTGTALRGVWCLIMLLVYEGAWLWLWMLVVAA